MTKPPAMNVLRAETELQGRRLLHQVVDHWAVKRPDAPALIDPIGGRVIDWRTLQRATSALAARLHQMGFRRGDFLAASLPFSLEHIFLEYACFRIGVVHAPLDLRLPPQEVLRCLNLLGAKGYAFPGVFRGHDFGELGRAAGAHCPSLMHRISPVEELVAAALQAPASALPEFAGEDDAAQVIFTTGSTGAPKAALLSHRNIFRQNLCLGAAFGFGAGTRMLVNLPPSHVGGQAEALMTSLFHGGTAVVLEAFDAAASLDAVRKHGVNLIGQIPAMFQLEWRLSGYESYDLSSLETVIWGGQQAPAQFIERLAAMAPRVGTGLGLTECAGFCTYTLTEKPAGDLCAGLGFDMPLYPMSIREPMREDGAAGIELPDGEIGQICFRGPQTFLGYWADPAATAKTVSRDGYLYTGDMGSRGARGLQFAGRSKWVIKPAGYQVFPGEIEGHFCALDDRVAVCGAVGVEHNVRSEGIVLFVEKRPGVDLPLADLKRHARGLASYMRPLRYVLLEAGQMPLNRSLKTDYVRLHQMALAEVDQLRARRRWER